MRYEHQEDLALQRPQVAPQGFGFLTVVSEQSLEDFFIVFSTQKNMIGRQPLCSGARHWRLQRENWDGEEKYRYVSNWIHDPSLQYITSKNKMQLPL